MIPKETHEVLRVTAGDKLLVVVRGDRVIVLQKPRRTTPRFVALAQVLTARTTFTKKGKVGADEFAGVFVA